MRKGFIHKVLGIQLLQLSTHMIPGSKVIDQCTILLLWEETDPDRWPKIPKLHTIGHVKILQSQSSGRKFGFCGSLKGKEQAYWSSSLVSIPYCLTLPIPVSVHSHLCTLPLPAREVWERKVARTGLSQGCERKEAVALMIACGDRQERRPSLRPGSKRNLEWELRRGLKEYLQKTGRNYGGLGGNFRLKNKRLFLLNSSSIF